MNEWLPHLDSLSGASLGALGAPYRWGREVLGLFELPAESGGAAAAGVIEAAIGARTRARERGDFAEADRIRGDLLAAGIVLEDDGPRTRWRATGGPGA